MRGRASLKKTDELARANRDAYFKSRTAPEPLDVKIGGPVGFTRYHLRSIGISFTDRTWTQLGIVTELRDPWILVRWDDATEGLVHPAHLARPGPNRRWCE